MAFSRIADIGASFWPAWSHCCCITAQPKRYIGKPGIRFSTDCNYLLIAVLQQPQLVNFFPDRHAESRFHRKYGPRSKAAMRAPAVSPQTEWLKETPNGKCNQHKLPLIGMMLTIYVYFCNIMHYCTQCTKKTIIYELWTTSSSRGNPSSHSPTRISKSQLGFYHDHQHWHWLKWSKLVQVFYPTSDWLAEENLCAHVQVFQTSRSKQAIHQPQKKNRIAMFDKC